MNSKPTDNPDVLSGRAGSTGLRATLPDRGTREISSFIAVALTSLLCLAGIGDLLELGQAAPGMDFYAAWSVAQFAGRADLEHPYIDHSLEQIDRAMRDRIRLAGEPERLKSAFEATQPLRATATPMLYSVFGLLSQSTYEINYQAFRHASLVSTVVAVLLLGHFFGFSLVFTTLFLACILWLFEPLRSDIRVGNVNQLLLLPFTAYLILLGQARDSTGLNAQDRITIVAGLTRIDLILCVAGVLIGLAASFKPLVAMPPVIVSLWWLLHRQFREVAMQGIGAFLGGSVALIVSAWRFGSFDIWFHWMDYVDALPHEAIRVSFGNFSPVLWFEEKRGWDLSLPVLVVGLVCVGFLLFRRRQKIPATDFDETHAAGMGFLVVLLASPLVWLHYLLLLVPFLMLVLRPRLGGSNLRFELASLTTFAVVAYIPTATLHRWLDPTLLHLGLIATAACLAVSFFIPGKIDNEGANAQGVTRH